MAINYQSTPGGASLTTDFSGIPGIGGGGAPGGFGGLDMNFIQQMAQRRADLAANERAKQAQRELYDRRRQENEDHMREKAFNIQLKNQEDAKRQAQMDAMSPAASATRWMKYLPGIGPVEVAEGTFGAYAAGNINAPTERHAQGVGLRPGLVGTSFSFLPHADNSYMEDREREKRQDEKNKQSGGKSNTPGMDAFKAWGDINALRSQRQGE